jgi:predicted phage terminase large subunit-like protein
LAVDQGECLMPVLESTAQLVEILGSPAKFAEWASDGDWEPAPHLLLLSDEIVNMVVNDSCDVLLVELPVRHGKSEFCSKYVPAWFMCRWPDLKVGIVSHTAKLAQDFSDQVRLILREVGEAFDVEVSKNTRAKDLWRLEGRRGECWAFGTDGSLTGRGFHLGVLDDPMDATDGFSANARSSLNTWYTRKWLTRREKPKRRQNVDGAPLAQRRPKQLVVMSRYADDDLSGWLQTHAQGQRVKVLHLPALAGDDDALGREVGEALWPDAYPLEWLHAARQADPFTFASQYQQEPVPDGGAVFDPSSFLYFDEIDAGDQRLWVLDTLDGRVSVAQGECWLFQTIDPAATKNSWSDYTVISTWAAFPGKAGDVPKLILVDRVRERQEFDTVEALAVAAFRKWQPSYVGVEDASYGKILYGRLLRQGIPCRRLSPVADKISRSQTAKVMCHAGQVFFPRQAPWIAEWVRELSQFPLASAHDDQVDTFSYAALEIAQGVQLLSGVIEKPRRSEDEQMWDAVHSSGARRTHSRLGSF